MICKSRPLVAVLHTLLGKHPIDRIRSVGGDKAEPVLDLYARFRRRWTVLQSARLLRSGRDPKTSGI